MVPIDALATPHRAQSDWLVMPAVSGVSTMLCVARAPCVSATARPRLLTNTCSSRSVVGSARNTSPVAHSSVSWRTRSAGVRLVQRGVGDRSSLIKTRATNNENGAPDKRSPFDKPPPKRIASPRFSEEAQTWALLGGVATALTVLVTLAVAANDEAAYFGGNFESDFSYMGEDFTGRSSSNLLSGVFANASAGSITASAIWSFGLFFKSPLQILLVFLGRTDTERPSDWMLRKLSAQGEGEGEGEGGDTASNTDSTNTRNIRTFEEASVFAKIATLGFFTVCGCGVVAAFDWAFAGEDTWGLSTGIGFTMLSFVAELGSPKRYSTEELYVLEGQYADFLLFAEESLERKGRCHSSEISRAFRRQFRGKYNLSDVSRDGAEELSEKDLYTMILNWHPNAERTSNGFFKNLSLKTGVDQRSTVTVKDLGL